MSSSATSPASATACQRKPSGRWLSETELTVEQRPNEEDLMSRALLKKHLLGSAIALLAVPLLASTAFAQVADVPRNETLVLTPWGDQPAQFANVENWNPYLSS